jgi:hypothetical protein
VNTLSPTPTQLQSQIGGLRRREEPSLSSTTAANGGGILPRQGSRESVVGGPNAPAGGSGRETPSFRSLQERYGGTPTSPTEFVLVAGKTPLSDLDYQKSARHTLIGELAR